MATADAAFTAMRFRLYPDREQAERLSSWIHSCRAAWNVALAQRIWAYRSAGRVTLGSVEQGRELTEARAEYDWLRDLPAQCAHRVLRQLDAAFSNFWNPNTAAGFPRFKKKAHRQALSFPAQAVQVQRVSRRMGRVRLPKVGWIPVRLSQRIDPRSVHNATVTRDGLGWHIGFALRGSEVVAHANANPPAGIDVGIACSVFVSSEDAPRQRPDTLTADEKRRLVGLERRKARQLRYAKRHAGGRYSRRLRRTARALSALTSKQARRRLDWNHKLTADLAKNHGLIAMEDLRVSNMVRSARGSKEAPGVNVRQKAGLNRSISDQGWSEIRRQLTYKTARCGGTLVVVPAAGTSQTCNNCGVRDPQSRKGCGRLFACTACGHSEHADRNAARNILSRALSAAGRAGLTSSGRSGAQSTRSRSRPATPREGAVRVNHPAGAAINPEGNSLQQRGSGRQSVDEGNPTDG